MSQFNEEANPPSKTKTSGGQAGAEGRGQDVQLRTVSPALGRQHHVTSLTDRSSETHRQIRAHVSSHVKTAAVTGYMQREGDAPAQSRRRRGVG